MDVINVNHDMYGRVVTLYCLNWVYWSGEWERYHSVIRIVIALLESEYHFKES